VVVTIRDGKPAFDCTPAKTPPLLAAPDDADGIDADDDEAEFLPAEPVA
jgi:hypothetical protein